MSGQRCRSCGHDYGWRGGISFGAVCELGRLVREHDEAEHPAARAEARPTTTTGDSQ